MYFDIVSTVFVNFQGISINNPVESRRKEQFLSPYLSNFPFSPILNLIQ